MNLEDGQRFDGTQLEGGCWVDRATGNHFVPYESAERDQAVEMAEKGACGSKVRNCPEVQKPLITAYAAAATCLLTEE
jgi:hypothetical protein